MKTSLLIKQLQFYFTLLCRDLNCKISPEFLNVKSVCVSEPPENTQTSCFFSNLSLFTMHTKILFRITVIYLKTHDRSRLTDHCHHPFWFSVPSSTIVSDPVLPESQCRPSKATARTFLKLRTSTRNIGLT